MKKIIFALAVITVIIPTTQSVSNAYSCDLGYSYNSATNTCDPYWMDFSGNDGFTKYAQLGIQSSNTGYENGISIKYWLEVLCIKKQLLVHVYSDPIGMYANTNIYGYGAGQIRFDNQKPTVFKYERDDNFEGVYATDARSFVTKLIKAKSSVSFKILGINGPSIATFPKSDFAVYVQSLRSMGCKA
jgi:hypothetical protein